jgi:hypothetical protein
VEERRGRKPPPFFDGLGREDRYRLFAARPRSASSQRLRALGRPLTDTSREVVRSRRERQAEVPQRDVVEAHRISGQWVDDDAGEPGGDGVPAEYAYGWETD